MITEDGKTHILIVFLITDINIRNGGSYYEKFLSNDAATLQDVHPSLRYAL